VWRLAAPTKNQMHAMFTNGIAPRIVHLRTLRPFSFAKKNEPTETNSDMKISVSSERKMGGSYSGCLVLLWVLWLCSSGVAVVSDS